MRDYLISLKIFPRENRWRRIARIVPPPNVNPLFTPGERRSFGGEKSAECVPAVSPVCLGQNDVTAGGLLGGVGLLRENENAPTRRGQVDKAGRQTFDGEQPPPVWLEEKLQKESIDPSSPSLPASLEDVSDLLILGIMEAFVGMKAFFFFFFEFVCSDVYDTCLSAFPRQMDNLDSAL